MSESPITFPHPDKNIVHLFDCMVCKEYPVIQFARALLHLNFEVSNPFLVYVNMQSPTWTELYNKYEETCKTHNLRPMIDNYDNQWSPLGFGTHCDGLVCHAPAVCEYCDKYSTMQQSLRRIWGVSFSGENDYSKVPCPSERFRSAEAIRRWGGNRPS